MNTRQSRRPHPTTHRNGTGVVLEYPVVDIQLEAQFTEYRTRLTALFACHRHLHNLDGSDTCSCGGTWPCGKEELAAWLLDDWV